MDKIIQEIVNRLGQLDNQRIESNLLPWQRQDIAKAQLLSADAATTPTQDELVRCARGLSSKWTSVCHDRAENFCFLKAGGNTWKVFLVDKYNSVLAQLDDYEGSITGVSEQSFLLKIQ